MERETKEITTPISGSKVVLKTWLTGKEKRQITSVYLNDLQVEKSDGSEEEPSLKVTGDMLQKSQDAAIEALIVSIDESTEKVLDTLLDLRDEDFQFVLNEINKITNPITEEGKKE